MLKVDNNSEMSVWAIISIDHHDYFWMSLLGPHLLRQLMDKVTENLGLGSCRLDSTGVSDAGRHSYILYPPTNISTNEDVRELIASFSEVEL